MMMNGVLTDPWPGLWRCRLLLFVFSFIGLSVFGTGLALVLQYRHFYFHKFASRMVLANPHHATNNSGSFPQSWTWPLFEKPFASSTLSLYFFNVTNPTEVIQKGEKPIVNQLGPYKFRVDKIKERIVFNEAETQITYWENIALSFLESAKNSTKYQSDQFVTIDSGSNTFKIRMVNDFLSVNNVNSGPTVYDEWNKRFVIDSGAAGLSKMFTVKRFNDKPPFNGVWQSFGQDVHSVKPERIFNLARGKLADSGFSPDVRRDSALSIFVPQICLPVDFSFLSASFGEMELNKFSLNTTIWNKISGSLNRASCRKQISDNGLLSGNSSFETDCLQTDGILNATKCHLMSEYPFVSLPHFFQAPVKIQNSVTGLSPDAAKHGSFVEVDVVSGMSLTGSIRLQFNTILRVDSSKSGNRSNLDELIILPVMWTEESFNMTSEKADYLDRTFYKPFYNFKYSAFSVLIGGASTFVFSIIIYYTCKMRHYHKKQKVAVARRTCVRISSSSIGSPQPQIEMSENSQFFTVNENEPSSFFQLATSSVNP